MANTKERTNFHMMEMWYIVFMSSLFYMCVVLPFGLYYSEEDEEKDFVSVLNFTDATRNRAFVPPSNGR